MNWFIIHPILLSNQSVPVAPGDLKIIKKKHIRTAARHTSLLTKKAVSHNSTYRNTYLDAEKALLYVNLGPIR